jgi:hypothetical protein
MRFFHVVALAGELPGAACELGAGVRVQDAHGPAPNFKGIARARVLQGSAERRRHARMVTPVSKSRGRQKKTPVPPQPRKRSWFARLSPEVRVIGLVVIIAAIAGAIVVWPRPEQEPPAPITVVIPAGERMHRAFQEARKAYIAAHKDADVILVEADDEKMKAYEAMWRAKPSEKSKTGGVDLLIGAEPYLSQWSGEGLLASWDDFLAAHDVRLSNASLEAGRVAGAQRMLPIGLELATIEITGEPRVSQPSTLQDLAKLAADMSTAGAPALGADWGGEWGEAVLLATAHAAGGDVSNVKMMLGHTKDALAWWQQGIAAGWARKPGVAGTPRLLWAGQRAWFDAGDGTRTRFVMPPGAADRGTVCVVYGALLPERSKHQDAARSFAADILLSRKFQVALAERTGLLPASVATWAKLKGPEWKELAAAAARSIPLSPNLRAPAATERFTREITGCLSGETSPEEAAAEIAALSSSVTAGR